MGSDWTWTKTILLNLATGARVMVQDYYHAVDYGMKTVPRDADHFIVRWRLGEDYTDLFAGTREECQDWFRGLADRLIGDR